MAEFVETLYYGGHWSITVTGEECYNNGYWVVCPIEQTRKLRDHELAEPWLTSYDTSGDIRPYGNVTWIGSYWQGG